VSKYEKWCEHICKGYDTVLGEHIFILKTTDEYIKAEWKYCPCCGIAKPKPRDEIELKKIFDNYHLSVVSLYEFTKQLLKWKRGS